MPAVGGKVPDSGWERGSRATSRSGLCGSGRVAPAWRRQCGGVFTFGVAVALWSPSRGMRAVLRAVGEIHDVDESRSRLRRALVALALVLCTLMATVVMLAMVVLGPLLGHGRALAGTWGVDDV